MFPCQQLENKHILIAITGGIAAYKVTELVRYLVTNDAEVRIIMTRAAEKFITRLTMETLSQNPVESELFPEKDYVATHHVHLADWADAVMIVPASYNMIGKLRAGIADDLVSTIMAAVHCPTVIAPAMNVHMWLNPVLQDNLKNLQKLGYLICPPEEGFLAEGYEGKGRLASLDHLIQYLYRAIHPAKKSLLGKKVIITAGRTEEAIDPVRILTNRSSGRMGYALAWEAFARGADVTLIHGSTHLPDPVDIECVPVNTAQDMFAEAKKRFTYLDIYISAAAIADYTPETVQPRKIKKGTDKLSLSLKATKDILKELSTQRRPHQLLVGYAMETDEYEKNALKKLNEKDLDLIVLNNILQQDAGIAKDSNQVTLYHKNGNKKELPVLPKLDVAFHIFHYLLEKE
jgi:phosphopantothenoylcysteine decarboxylase/phosphopantothenate--cysteine ligase